MRELAVPAGTAIARVAEAQAGEERLVRGRRLHRAARRAQSVRRAAGRRAEDRAGACASPATSAAASPMRQLDRLARLLAPLETTRCPFDKRPVTNEKPHWTRPVLVAEVRFLAIIGRRHAARADLRRPARRCRLGSSRGATVQDSAMSPRGDAAPTAIAVAGARRADKPPSRAALARVRDQLDALAERGGGRLLLPDGVALADHEPREAAVARARRQQSRSVPPLPRRRAVHPAGGARSPAGDAALPRRRRRPRRSSSTARPTTCRRAFGARRSPATTSPRASSAAG